MKAHENSSITLRNSVDKDADTSNNGDKDNLFGGGDKWVGLNTGTYLPVNGNDGIGQSLNVDYDWS